MSKHTPKRITLDGIMALRPCKDYPRERIAGLMAGRESVTALDVLDAEGVPAEDRLWLVLHKELIPAPLLRELACDFAQAALDSYGNGDERSQQAIDIALGYAAGMVADEDLLAAGAAAGAAWAAGAAARAAGEAAGEAQLAHARAALRKAGVQ